MPPVYAKSSATTWWCCTDGKNTDDNDNSFPQWITDHCVIMGENETNINLRDFFHQSCQPFERDKYLERHNAIYYLVVQHQGYEVAESDTKFTNPCEIQIYIGCASGGVKARWLGHCSGVNKILKAKRDLTKCKFRDLCYDNQQVDNFVALAWLCGFKMALFVVKCCDREDEMEKNEGDFIRQHAAKSYKHGLNRIDGKKQSTATPAKQPAKP